MTKPAISVVIPTYNEAKYLPPCIAAIQAQTFTDFEVIALDKSSTDATVSMCQAAGFKVVDQKSRIGISAARAEGFSHTKADIIASTNADTAVCPDWLEKITTAFLDPSVVCICGPVYFLEGRTQFFYRFMSWLSYLIFTTNHLLGNNYMIGENFAVRKSAYDKIGGFNPALITAEDVDLGYRISKVGKCVYDPKLVALTSNRRLAHEKFGFFTHHIANFIRLKLTGRASTNFKPVR
jgi:GT2 family glycosyltransferase